MDRKVLMLAVILFALAVRFQNFGEISIRGFTTRVTTPTTT